MICAEEVRKSPLNFMIWFNRVIPGEEKSLKQISLPSDMSNYMIWRNKGSYKPRCAYLHYILTTAASRLCMGDALGQELSFHWLLVRCSQVPSGGHIQVRHFWSQEDRKQNVLHTCSQKPVHTKICASLIQRLPTRLFLKKLKKLVTFCKFIFWEQWIRV